MKVNAYRHNTRCGTFWIALLSDGRWHAAWEDEDLGAYASPQHALDDLAGGTTYWPSSGVNPASLGLPDEISEWTPVRLSFA